MVWSRGCAANADAGLARRGRAAAKPGRDDVKFARSLRLAGGLAWRTLAKSRFTASSIARSDPP